MSNYVSTIAYHQGCIVGMLLKAGLDATKAQDIAAEIMHDFLMSQMTHVDWKIVYKALIENKHLPTEEDVSDGEAALTGEDDLP